MAKDRSSAAEALRAILAEDRSLLGRREELADRIDAAAIPWREKIALSAALKTSNVCGMFAAADAGTAEDRASVAERALSELAGQHQRQSAERIVQTLVAAMDWDKDAQPPVHEPPMHEPPMHTAPEPVHEPPHAMEAPARGPLPRIMTEPGPAEPEEAAPSHPLTKRERKAAARKAGRTPAEALDVTQPLPRAEDKKPEPPEERKAPAPERLRKERKAPAPPAAKPPEERTAPAKSEPPKVEPPKDEPSKDEPAKDTPQESKPSASSSSSGCGCGCLSILLVACLLLGNVFLKNDAPKHPASSYSAPVSSSSSGAKKPAGGTQKPAKQDAKQPAKEQPAKQDDTAEAKEAARVLHDFYAGLLGDRPRTSYDLLSTDMKKQLGPFQQFMLGYGRTLSHKVSDIKVLAHEDGRVTLGYQLTARDSVGKNRVKVQTFQCRTTLSKATGSWHIVEIHNDKTGERME